MYEFYGFFCCWKKLLDYYNKSDELLNLILKTLFFSVEKHKRGCLAGQEGGLKGQGESAAYGIWQGDAHHACARQRGIIAEQMFYRVGVLEKSAIGYEEVFVGRVISKCQLVIQ